MKTVDLLIAGGLNDPNIAILTAAAHAHGCTAAVLTYGDGSEPSMSWDLNSGSFVVDSEEIKPRAAFLRQDVFSYRDMLEAVRLDKGMAWHATLFGLCLSDVSIHLLNREIDYRAGSKPAMLKLAAAHGLPIPETLISNTENAVAIMSAGAPVIAKPVAGGAYCMTMKEVMTNSPWREGVAAAPAIVQMHYSRSQRCLAEFLGTAFLLATVVGSGIMAERLADGNIAIALLGNTLPTGAILVVMITMLGPISGAHFNPAVTCVFALRREISIVDSITYIVVQIHGALIGVVMAHLMFEEVWIQYSEKTRTGGAQWFAEGIATFGFIFVILASVKVKDNAVAMVVGLYIVAAYWFTASTSFANPAVTIARSFSNTFAGIRPIDMPFFILAQLFGALLALVVSHWLLIPQKKQPALKHKGTGAVYVNHSG